MRNTNEKEDLWDQWTYRSIEEERLVQVRNTEHLKKIQKSYVINNRPRDPCDPAGNKTVIVFITPTTQKMNRHLRHYDLQSRTTSLTTPSSNYVNDIP